MGVAAGYQAPGPSPHLCCLQSLLPFALTVTMPLAHQVLALRLQFTILQHLELVLTVSMCSEQAAHWKAQLWALLVMMQLSLQDSGRAG